MAGHSAIMSVRITGNSDDAVRAFSKATSKAAAFGSFMGGMAVKGVTALWDKLKGFTSAVMDMSDSTDKFKQTMGFAGLDTTAIDKATKATRAYADSTVYDLSTVQNTTAQLAANGIRDYVDLTEAAGNLNAVAGGNADTFNSVAMVLTQTAGAGKLTTENWNQLADAIPGASGKLQEAMKANGAYTGNFRDAMAEGQITADEFNQAIMQLGMSDVAKQAASSTATMEGALGNLEAAVTGGLTDAFNVFKPAVTSAIGVASEQITTFSAKATTGLKGVIALVRAGDISADLRAAFNIEEDSPIIDFLLTLRETAIGTFSTVREQVSAFLAAFRDTGPAQAAADIFSSVWDACKSLAGAAGDLLAQFAPLAGSMGGAGGAGTALGNAFNGAASIIGTVSGKLNEFSGWVSANAQPISAALAGIAGGFAAFKTASIISSVATGLQAFAKANSAASIAQWALNAAMNANPVMIVVTALGALVAALVWFFTQTDTGRALWQSFMDWLAPVWQQVQAAWTAVWNSISAFLTSTWNAISGVVQPIISGIASFIQSNMGTIQAVWNAIWGAISAYIGGVWNGIQITVQTAIGVVQGIIKTVTSLIQGDWSGAWNGIKQIALSIWNGIGALIGNAINTVRSIISSVLSGIGAIWNAAWSGLTNAVSGTVGRVISYVSGLPGRILSALGNIGTLLWDAGSSILEGFLDGLKSAWNNVTDFVGGIGDWIKEHKGPPSYDKVLLTRNGRFIMQGLAKGLGQGFDQDVRRTIAGINRRMGTVNLGANVTTGTTPASGAATQVTNINVTIQGKLLDREGTAAEILKLLKQYQDRRV